MLLFYSGFAHNGSGIRVMGRGATDASRVRIQLSSSRVVYISSRARTRIELDSSSLNFESSSSSSRAYSSRVLIESSPSSSLVVSFH